MTEKKISFGFKQVKKPQILIASNAATEKKESVEMIECLEGQTIKIIGKNEDEKEKPLVIPLKDGQKTSAALAMLQKLRSTINGAEEEQETKPEVGSTEVIENGAQTLDQRATNELLKEAKGENNKNEEQNTLSLPLNSDQLPLDGASESTLDDYEQIPVAMFGLACLRGMGLKEEDIANQKSKASQPELRPKGMGLGADKIAKPTKLLVAPAPNETLEIKKGACVRILAGKYRDLYGQIESLDDETGRLIVKLALGGGRESITGSLVQPISKQEYAQYSKVLNSAKYEEYKRKQEETENRKIKQEKDQAGGSSQYKMKEERRNYPDDENYDKKSSNHEEDHRKIKQEHDHESSSNQQKIKEERRSDSDDEKYDKKRSNHEERHSSRGRDKQNDHYEREKSRNKYDKSRSYDRDRRVSPKPRKDDHASKSSRSRYSRSRSKDNNRQRYRSSSASSSASSSSREASRSSRKESRKKHKSKSHKTSKSRYCDSDRDTRHLKKKTKKSKRPRSRSRDRN